MRKTSYLSLLTLFGSLAALLLCAHGLKLLWFLSESLLPSQPVWLPIPSILEFFLDDLERYPIRETLGWFYLTLGLSWIGALSGVWLKMRWGFVALILVAGCSTFLGGASSAAALLVLMLILWIRSKRVGYPHD